MVMVIKDRCRLSLCVELIAECARNQQHATASPKYFEAPKPAKRSHYNRLVADIRS